MLWFFVLGITCAEQLTWLPDAWFYPSGSLVTFEPWVGGHWYYENGQLIGVIREDSMWYRPSGEFFRFAPRLNAAQIKDVPWVLANIERWLSLPPEEPTYDHLWIRRGPRLKAKDVRLKDRRKKE